MKLEKSEERSLENETYLQRRTLQLRQWQRVLDRLISKVDQVKGKNRKDLQHDIRNIQTKRKRMDIKLKELNKASNEKWDEIKTNIETGWKELREAFLISSANLKTKIND